MEKLIGYTYRKEYSPSILYDVDSSTKKNNPYNLPNKLESCIKISKVYTNDIKNLDHCEKKQIERKITSLCMKHF